MSTSPSGRYVFAADYGGVYYGSGALPQSYVHRLDLSSNTWETKTAYIAGNIQAVSDDQFILKSLDQFVTFTNNLWGTGGAVVPINTPSGTYWGPGYYPGVSSGDFRYDVTTGRLLHGNSGSSSQEITVFKIVGNDFQKWEGSGTYGSAWGYGGTVVLATDGSAFYYGALQVDPLDVTHNLRVFPEKIYAATGDIAFGNGNYYDARTGALLGSLGFQTTVYGLNPHDDDFWAYDAGTNTLRYFVPLDHITISPSSATIIAGGSQDYLTQVFDRYGNSLGDVTAATTFSISPDGSCNGPICSATVPGPHTVTAKFRDETAASSLQVAFPTGTITVNGGAVTTRTLSVTLTLTASSGITSMCISNTSTCTSFKKFAAKKKWNLTSGSGIRTVNVWYRDRLGNTSLSPYSDTIMLDTAAPTNGTIFATPGSGQMSLTWDGFSDALSGINGYILKYAAGKAPSSCKKGTLLYSGPNTSFTHTGLAGGTSYGYRVCAIDGAGNTSTGAMTSATSQ